MYEYHLCDDKHLAVIKNKYKGDDNRKIIKKT